MIQVNDTGLDEYYKQCAANARAIAELATSEETRAVHLNRARLYDQIAASYVTVEPESRQQ